MGKTKNCAKQKRELKEKLLMYLFMNGASTLAAITKHIPEFEGKCTVTHRQDSNIILWHGLSETGNEVLHELQDKGYITADVADIWMYLYDGQSLGYPVAKCPPRNGYRKPHWLPILFGLTEKGRNIAY